MRIRLSGHLGDACFTMAVVRNLGGMHDLVLCDSENVLGAFLPIAPLITPVMELQPYVKSITLSNTAKYDIDTTDFRRRFHNRSSTLLGAQISEVERIMGGSISRDTSPWLSGIDPHSYSYDRIIVARSYRYRNLSFPWKELVKNLGDQMLFVGTRDEHKDFENNFGWVEHFITKDLLEVGQLIAGAKLFIGNQSGPHSIAMGMGVSIVQETSPVVPDCVFKRDNVIYGTDQRFELYGKTYGGPDIDEEKLNLTVGPPGQWQYAGMRCYSLDQLVGLALGQDHSISKKDLRKQIIHANVLRVPGHFTAGGYVDPTPWKEAFENTGIPYTPTK